MDKNVVLVINLYTYPLICMQKTIVRVGGIMRDIKYMEITSAKLAAGRKLPSTRISSRTPHVHLRSDLQLAGIPVT